MPHVLRKSETADDNTARMYRRAIESTIALLCFAAFLASQFRGTQTAKCLFLADRSSVTEPTLAGSRDPYPLRQWGGEVFAQIIVLYRARGSHSRNTHESGDCLFIARCYSSLSSTKLGLLHCCHAPERRSKAQRQHTRSWIFE